MTTVIETLFSRPIPFDRDEAQPGDRINMANAGRPPYWQALIAVVACEDSPEDEGECDGDCAFVLHLEPGTDDEDGCDVAWWHVSWNQFDEIKTSLPAVSR